MGGDHPDASPIRVGEDFYLTHSSFDYAPGLLIWHSRDLINWRPVAAALAKNLQETSALTNPVGGHSYTVEVEVEADSGCEAGLLLFYNPEHATGITLSSTGIHVRVGNGLTFDHQNTKPARATLRLVNDRQEVDFYFRIDEQAWQRAEESAEISGMHHNVSGSFLDVRPALCAWGVNSATFRKFRYWPEVNLPQS